MNDVELQAMYQRLVVGPSPADRTACVSPEQLMRAAAGDAAEDERLRTLEHVAQCAACRAEMEFACAVAEAGAALEPRRTLFVLPRRILALAAAIVLIVGGVALWRSRFDSGDVVRGSDAAVTLIAPLQLVALERARILVWRPVAGATLYEVEVLDESAAPVFAAGVVDTTAALPDTTMLTPGVEYRWRVTAVLPDGRRLRSAAQAVRVRGPATP